MNSRVLLSAVAALLVVIAVLVAQTDAKEVGNCGRYCGLTSTFRTGTCEDCCVDNGYNEGGSCKGWVPSKCQCDGNKSGKGKKPEAAAEEEEEEAAPADDTPADAAGDPTADADAAAE